YPGGLLGDVISQNEFHATFKELAGANEEQKDKIAKKLEKMLADLPPENQAFFQECLDLIDDAARYKEQNQMDKTSLVLVIAPNFFPLVPASLDNHTLFLRHQEGIDGSGTRMATKMSAMCWG